MNEAGTLVRRWCEARHLDVPSAEQIAWPERCTCLPPVAEDRWRKLGRMAMLNGSREMAAMILAELRESLDL